MKPKADDSYESLKDKHCQAEIKKAARYGHDDGNDKEARGERTGEDRNPFCVEKESVGGVIGEAENEIAKESAGREQHNPSGPLERARGDHAIDKKQEAQAG